MKIDKNYVEQPMLYLKTGLMISEKIKAQIGC